MAVGTLSSATDQSDPVEFDIELKQEGEEIDKLQEELHKRTTEYNEKLARKAAGTSTSAGKASPALKKVAPSLEEDSKKEMTLEQRVIALEQEVIHLKNPQKKGYHIPTEAELAATKKAEANAPVLVANTPAVAQYNQAQSLLKNNELEKAKEAFLQIIHDYPHDIYAAKSYLHLGEIHLQLKNFGEAEKAFKEALTTKLELPLMTQARLGFAEALRQLDKQEECCQQLKVLEKEALDEDQKKRLKTLVEKTNCQKIDQSKTEQRKKD
jgi:TolA-binding protein